MIQRLSAEFIDLEAHAVAARLRASRFTILTATSQFRRGDAFNRCICPPSGSNMLES